MANSFEHISICAVKVLARLAAKKAVEAELKAQCVRVTLVEPAEISARTQVYLADHPELIDEAKARALRLGLLRRRTERNS